MSLEDAQHAIAVLADALSEFVNKFSAPPWDDGDLDPAISQVTPALEAVVDSLLALFAGQLQQLKSGAELDEVVSLLAQVLDNEAARHAASAATQLLYVIQRCNYGHFSDPDPGATDPNVEDNTILLNEGLDALLVEARKGDHDDED